MYSQELAATTDYRDVLAEVCTKRFKNPRLDGLPGARTQTDRLSAGLSGMGRTLS